MHELEYVGLGIPPSKDLDCICNVPIALLKTGCIARVDPEYPRLRRSLSSLVGIFDGKLRFSTRILALAIQLLFARTQHRRDRRVLSKILELHIFAVYDPVDLLVRRSLRRGGKGRWTMRRVEFLVALQRGAVVVSASWLGVVNLPGGRWNSVLTEPLMIPAWKPRLPSPKDTADAILISEARSASNGKLI